MSHSGVSDTYPYVNSAQRNFHFYARTTAGDSDNEQGYSGTPPFSNESNLEDDSEGGMEGATDSEEEIEEREYNYHNHSIFRFPNVNHPSPIYPNSTDATFGSLEPVIRDISSRPNQNLRSTQLSSSPPQPSNNRSAGNMTSFIGFSPENDHTPISSPPNILGHYSSNRTRAFSNSRSSSAIVATPSNEPTYPRLQSQSQPPPFFYHRTFAPSRRNFNHSVPQPVEPRRPTSTSNHNGEEQQGYSINFAPASPDITFMYPEVIQQSERRPHHHSNNISGLSQASRASPTSSSTTSRWTSRDPRGRAEILTRPIMPNPNFNRRKVARILGSDEEQDNLTELPESSDSEVNVTTSAPAVRAQFRPPRRHEPRQDNNTIDPTRSRTLAALAAATAVRANSTNDGSLSADEQIARRMQAYEYSSIQNTIDEQNVLARFLGASRARSTTNRRETTSGSSSSSRNESSRRNISTRGTARLPEILSHERHHHEERGNEPRSRGHSRGSQSRNGGRSSSASNYLHHHFIPHYPLLGNLIDSGEIELEDFLDLWPVWGNGIAANPDNYLDEDEFDSSYEGLLRLCERIGDAKPKGVSEDVIKTLPAKTFIAGKSKTAEERCTICLTGYESNDMLRDLPCSHDFHQDCIDSWFKNSDKCPICRRSIVEK
ncbi:10365_t:CDS:2 [Funneliformis geosporum]|uniref:10365_t:CDS:1 n=1 Tax=Funneliformis geosporum TaxID=1117311 RepID=A0A9W4ST57_9GLOM|nr:10365_t:CDS:2 [Funneliformis geosporum]